MNTLSSISFKRKQKAPASSSPFSIPSFLTSTTSSTTARESPAPQRGQPRLSHLYTDTDGNDSTDLILNYLDTPHTADESQPNTKDTNGLDWYIEGPGRRVGYDDLTAIDWIFEYAKERQRLRYLYSSATGILGYIKQLADASQIWLILIAAGISAGGVAAFIDVATLWLGDLKEGFCENFDGESDGRFYLNKGFCCWGYSGWFEWLG